MRPPRSVLFLFTPVVLPLFFICHVLVTNQACQFYLQNISGTYSFSVFTAKFSLSDIILSPVYCNKLFPFITFSKRTETLQ